MASSNSATTLESTQIKMEYGSGYVRVCLSLPLTETLTSTSSPHDRDWETV